MTTGKDAAQVQSLPAVGNLDSALSRITRTASENTAKSAHAWLQNRNSEAELRSFLFSINDTYQKDIEDHNPNQKDQKRY